MGKVTQFLLRWLYLANLIDDRIDVQNIPPPLCLMDQPHYPDQNNNNDNDGNSSPYRDPHQDGPAVHGDPDTESEQEWRHRCVRGIAMYPPGVLRLLALDSLRADTIHRLDAAFRRGDDLLSRAHHSSSSSATDDDDVLTLTADADCADDDIVCLIDAALRRDGAGTSTTTTTDHGPAGRLLSEAREYLPQLVSTVLHSRGALTLQLNPAADLRSMLLSRCTEDPSLGIELCWLLEAEVGRTWKTLFEHRQQTGKRLIVVLPAEKARVIAKIGIEKRAAFDLLQDAEQATAYGSYHHHNNNNNNAGRQHNVHHHHHHKLPAALSLKRCSHFGDTMHFIDSLTGISLDLRMVPAVERNAALQSRLSEMNRRLRRRMVTRGAVSLDVEDNLAPDGWPRPTDVTTDLLRYSVHFPLEPKTVLWQGGTEHPSSWSDQATTLPSSSHDHPTPGVMRALHIVTSECRLLASRERCPFLVQLEVAETGLQGSDARLYGGGGSSGGTVEREGEFGVTLEEVVRLLASSSHGTATDHDDAVTPRGDGHDDFASYRIPAELISRDRTARLATTASSSSATTTNIDDHLVIQEADTTSDNNNGTQRISMAEVEIARGGWQPPDDESSYHTQQQQQHGAYYNNSPYDTVRQDELQQLHEQMISDRLMRQAGRGSAATTTTTLSHQQQQPSWNQGSEQATAPTISAAVATALTDTALLDQVFGLPWETRCQQIRQSSPYGNVKGWRLASFILKAGEDIRREALVMQVISKLDRWFQEEIPERLRPYLKPYTIMCVGGDAGLLECLSDAKSVDEVKKLADNFTTLRDYFERCYGKPGAAAVGGTTTLNNMQIPPPPPYTPGGGMAGGHATAMPPPPPPPMMHSPGYNLPYATTSPPAFATSTSSRQHQNGNTHNISFEQAQDNFLRSLVGYSLVCYILQIKDRHNANILLDRQGHLIHIDFGFVLGDTPKMGKVPLFSERAPFKLTTEFWDVLGGWNVQEGGQGVRFCKIFEAAFERASFHSEEIATLIEAAVLNLTSNSAQARALADGVRSRLRMRGAGKDSAEQKMFVMNLVNAALTSWGTSTYDWLQKSMNGYQ